MYNYNLYRILIPCVVLFLAVTACYEDKGNYDYIVLDEVKIDTTGLNIQPAYVLDRYDSLEINPNIYFNGSLVQEEQAEIPLNYMWTIYSSVTSANSDYTIDTLSYSKHLREPIKRSAGQYYVLLTISNEENKTQEYFKVSCLVEESISAGWLVFYEVAGQADQSDAALIVNPWVKRNVIKNREFYDLYKASNGAHLKGSPLHVMHTCVNISEDEVILVTDQEMVGVNNGSFGKILDFKDFFYDAPSEVKPTYYGAGGTTVRSETLISGNKLYRTLFSALSRSNFFGIPYGGNYGQLAAWGSNVHNTSYDAIVYDQTDGCFKCINKNAVRITPFAAQDPASPFDINSLGAELVMGDWGRNYYDYVLMKKGNQHFLAVANFKTSSISTTNIGLNWIDVSASPGIGAATSMAAAYQGEHLLYGSGSAVYNLKYGSSGKAETLWKAPGDELVTCVRLQKYYFQSLFLAMLPNANQLLHVATWSETKQEGKLYQFKINPANGAILEQLTEYTIPGKVKDMAWKKAMEN